MLYNIPNKLHFFFGDIGGQSIFQAMDQPQMTDTAGEQAEQRI